MPSRWEIALAGPRDAGIPLAAPQAVISGWLDDRPGRPPGPGGPARSAHGGPTRAWACGPIRAVPPDGTGETGPMLVLQVRLLDDALAGRLHQAATPGGSVRFGEHHFRIAGPAREIGRMSWPELRRWSGERAWQVRFLTPVCLRRGNRTSPWPAPDSVARGLADRWARLDPATAPAVTGGDRGQVWVSDFDGHTQAQTLTRRARHNGQWRFVNETISGFTGRIRYVCDHGSDAEAAAFSALIAFAAFAGAGSHTTYGFGALAAEPTWQPPTVQASPR